MAIEIDEDKDMETLWDTLDEFLNNDFSAQQGTLEGGYFGKFILLFLDEEDFNEEDYDNLQGPVTSAWKAGRGTPNEFKEALTGRINQQDLEKELENPPKENEVIVLLYTLEGEYITSFNKTSERFEYDCDECYETFTFGETIQADPNDEWIRCCSNCIELRS